jgi:hypothetical protein
MEKDTNKFPDGLMFKRPRDGAPEFVKGALSVNVPRFIEWLKNNVGADEWANFDLKQSKEKGTLYLEHNTWKKTSIPDIQI